MIDDDAYFAILPTHHHRQPTFRRLRLPRTYNNVAQVLYSNNNNNHIRGTAARQLNENLLAKSLRSAGTCET